MQFLVSRIQLKKTPASMSEARQPLAMFFCFFPSLHSRNGVESLSLCRTISDELIGIQGGQRRLTTRTKWTLL